jgi:transcriptional regulator with XRE-family HTH domain
MISPYVRRLRLARELRALRIQAGLTHEQLARKIGQSRAQISRLENGHVVDQADILSILDTLGVDGDRWTQIMTIAREAGERGWWESSRGMGVRQALYADLEAGATTIREYQQTFLPGLLQTPGYVRSRIESELEPMTGTAEGVLAGRLGRQRMLRRPGGATYEVIIDEMAIRRLTAPADVIGEQLSHIVTVVNAAARLSLRVLPIKAGIEGFAVPRSAFAMYTYADAGDPVVVTIDTVTDDLVLTDDDAVRRYDELYRRLREAALTGEKSMDLLARAAGTRPGR